MIRISRGKAISIVRDDGDVVELRVVCEGVEGAAVAYPGLTGSVAVGDEVLLNTTAVALGLGSGGSHFVMAVLSGEGPDGARKAGAAEKKSGHIMKLNYTPLQTRVLSVEEEDSPHHGVMRDAAGLDGIPVLAGSVHSMVAPLCASLKVLLGDKVRVVYVMTDASCLPMGFSRTVRTLKDKGLLDGTVSCGQAFGGDIEAVNKFSGLVAARRVLGADVIVSAMGVGIVGTGTALGHGGMEQGEVINAVAALGGAAVAVPRISFAEARERHRGVSHHTLAALGVSARERAVVPLPVLEDGKMSIIRKMLEDAGIYSKHTVVEFDGEVALEAMREFGLNVKVMGRGTDEDREYFLACGAAARAAAGILEEKS